MSRKDVFYKTKKSIVITSTAIVFICLFVFAIITQFIYTTRVYSAVDNQLINEKRMLQLAPPGKYKTVDYLFKDKRGGGKPPSPNMIVIIHEGGNLVFLSPNAYFDEKSKLPIFLEEDKIQTVKADSYNFRGISFKDGTLEIQYLINVDSEIKSINQLMTTLISALVVLIIIAIGMSIVLASKILKPVKESYDKQVFFVQDASHEMRTPLSIIKGKLEILANSYGDTIDEHFDKVSKMMSEINSLEKLNSDLLLLSKEDIDSNISLEKVKLNDFIENIVSFYVDIAEIQDKNFSYNKVSDLVEVEWDIVKIKRMVIILLENSFKYTKAKDSIAVTFEVENKNIKVRVKDTGIGMKEEDIPRVFDRFFRSDDVRGRNIDGSGIGLSLLKSIGNTLGIKIGVTSKLGEGTEFSLIIPKVIR